MRSNDITYIYLINKVVLSDLDKYKTQMHKTNKIKSDWPSELYYFSSPVIQNIKLSQIVYQVTLIISCENAY